MKRTTLPFGSEGGWVKTSFRPTALFMALFVWLLPLSAPLAQNPYTAHDDSLYVLANYEKAIYRIPMRDGVMLHTIVYSPKDKSKTYPIMLRRTCYDISPYEEGVMPTSLGPSTYMMREGYIFVHQDVRGRYMSDGEFDNMRPHIPGKPLPNPKAKPKKGAPVQIDESSDTYDTIEWLIKNLKGNNGRVGQWGISYPGFYAIAGAVEGHPALKASSPQAPIGDFFFDDFHHNGAYLLSYWMATPVFGYQKKELTTKDWYKFPNTGTPDGYQFYLDMGPLKNASKYYGPDNFFWQQLVEHPNYDEFWQKRSIIPHVSKVTPAIMTVGGWFDAEDLYGPLTIYKTIEKTRPGHFNTLVMGPWGHGDWSRRTPETYVGNIGFGTHISDFYQREIEAKFFRHHLKDDKDVKLPEAFMFDTGRKQWQEFAQWPPVAASNRKLFLLPGGKLSFDQAPASGAAFTEYISDPAKPVPYSEDIKVDFTPRKYMTDDQRFAGRRPDVIVFQTDALEEDITLGGEIMARLKVSTSGTDSDWVVKLIDVFPPDTPNDPKVQSHLKLGGYQMMVRSEVMRGRFRNSFEKPEPFTPDTVTDVDFRLQDVLHTFKKGHRIMIQIQSTWFPLIDRNPQKFVENIFKADEADFIKATQRVYHSPQAPSHLEIQVVR